MTKKAIITFLLLATGVVGLSFIAPWWATAIWVVMITCLTGLSVKESILSGGFVIGLVWVVMARYMSLQDDADIISKTGALLGGLSHQLMMVATLGIALITGILSGWFGSVLGHFIRQKTKEEM